VPSARLRRGRLDVTVALPEAVQVERAGDRVIATAPGLLFSVTAEPAAADARSSTQQAVAVHLARLAEAQLLDVAEAPPDGMRMLLHHVGESGATCLEEWRFVRAGHLVTLSFQCAAPAYDALADTAAAAAASLR